MKPILYKSTETEFKSNGIGVLSDAISCIVTEKRNGVFDLQLKYPVDGIHYSDIEDRSIILAKPNPTDDAQPFRVYRSTKPLNGIVTFFANHISYDLLGIPVSPFTATDAVDALNKLKSNAVLDCPFTFHTDKATVATMNVRVPQPIRSLLAGQSGSVLDVYGGEYKFDRFDVGLYQHRGSDRGVAIRYGKNLLDLEQERNISNVYTGVYPYWTDMNGENLVQLPEKIVNAPGTYGYSRIKVLDLSSTYEEAPTVEQIRAKAESYIKNNDIGVPSVNLTVSHAMLENTEEYKGKALLERIDLCDTVSIEFTKLGISATAKAIEVEYNVLLDRYDSITFGNAPSSFIQTAVEQLESDKKYTELARGLVGQAMDRMNQLIQNASGLYVTTDEQADGSVIYYYHDKKTLDESNNVMKWTADGVGFSTDGGKNYPFGFAVTGDMVANILSAIGVNAEWINAGVINLGLLKLAGTLTGIMEGYGATKDGHTTKGIVVYANDVNESGDANPPYLIVTDAGIRGQETYDNDFNMSRGYFEVNGNITSRAAGSSDGSIYSEGQVTAKNFYIVKDGETYTAAVMDEDGLLNYGHGIAGTRGVFLNGNPLYIGVGTNQVNIRGNVDFSSATVSGLNLTSLRIGGEGAIYDSGGNTYIGKTYGTNVLQGGNVWVGGGDTSETRITGSKVVIGSNSSPVSVGRYQSDLSKCVWSDVTINGSVHHILERYE